MTIAHGFRFAGDLYSNSTAKNTPRNILPSSLVSLALANTCPLMETSYRKEATSSARMRKDASRLDRCDVACWQILLQKSKIEQPRKSRGSRFLVGSATATLSRRDTTVYGRFCEMRCGPSRRRMKDAPAVLKNFVRQSKKTFSTLSAQSRRSTRRSLRAQLRVGHLHRRHRHLLALINESWCGSCRPQLRVLAEPSSCLPVRQHPGTDL
jgi:hypothetical protein